MNTTKKVSVGYGICVCKTHSKDFLARAYCTEGWRTISNTLPQERTASHRSNTHGDQEQNVWLLKMATSWARAGQAAGKGLAVISPDVLTAHRRGKKRHEWGQCCQQVFLLFSLSPRTGQSFSKMMNEFENCEPVLQPGNQQKLPRAAKVPLGWVRKLLKVDQCLKQCPCSGWCTCSPKWQLMTDRWGHGHCFQRSLQLLTKSSR